MVSVKIPKQERHGTDLPRLPCIVVQVLGKTQVKYRLRCQNGVIDSTFRGGDLEQYNGTFTEDLSVTGWESVKRISLRSASHMIWNETGTTRCICKSGCTTERCRCRKAQRLCSSRCHAGKSCKNGSTDGKESKRTIAKSKTADNQGQPQKETCYERKQEVNLSEEATLSKKPGNSVSPDPRQGTTTASSIATRTSIGIGKRDIKILESSTAWLNDLIINAGQKLIHVSFPLWNGFQNTLLSNRLQFSVSRTKTVQIHHSRGNHWVMSASDEAGEVTLYDSLFLGDISQDVQAQLASIYRTEKDILKVKVASVHKQKSGCDCGLFALAFAVDVASGIDPAYVRYRQSEMRQHLLQCILKGTITLFPRFMPGERGAVTVKRVRPAIVAIAVHCVCRVYQRNFQVQLFRV